MGPVLRKSAGGRIRNTDGYAKKNTHKSKIITITIVGVALICVALFFIIGGIMGNDKVDIEQYLEQKYGTEFTVEDLRSSAVGLGMPGQRVGVAHPVSDPSLRFEAGKDRNANSFFDNYVGAVWAKQERPLVAEYLSSIYGALGSPDFVLTVQQDRNTPESEIVKGANIPDVEFAKTSLKNNLYYSIEINATADQKLTAEEIDDHNNKLKQIIDFVLSKGVSSPGVRYAINVEGQDVGYLCSPSKDELNNSTIISNCLIEKRGKVW